MGPFKKQEISVHTTLRIQNLKNMDENSKVIKSWVGGVVVRNPAFHAGGRGFDSHIRQS